MTLPEDFTNAVREWLDQHGPVPCTIDNGKTQLMAIYKGLVPGKNDKQAANAVRDAIRNSRGIIAPEKTAIGLKRKAVGEPTSAHDSERKKANAISNPISSAIKKAALASANRAELLANPLVSHLVLSESELENEVKSILRRRLEEFGGMSIEEALRSGGYSVYVGMTRRSIADEFLRFLTIRGSLDSSEGNRPILMKDEDFRDHFTMSQAIQILGAVGVEVHCSRLRYNASAIEDRLQTFMKDELGLHYPNRLFRAVALGVHREDEATLNGEETIHRTFLTIFKIAENSVVKFEEPKSYPKSVRFVNAAGEQTTVYIHA